MAQEQVIDRPVAKPEAPRAGVLENFRRRLSVQAGGREDSVVKRALIHAALIFFVIIAVYPVLRVFTISLRPGDRLLSTDLSIIPSGATWHNYYHIFFETDFPLWVWNSLTVTIGVSIIGVALAATSAYAFSRWNFPGRRPGLVFLLTTQMIPPGMLLIPLYIMAVQIPLLLALSFPQLFSDFHLFNSYRGLVFAYAVGSVPFSIWILKGYYDTIPPDLEEAAKIDGASQLEAFWKIILPLSTPALVIVFLFNFMAAWNDYLLARIMLQDQSLLTWTLGFDRLQGQFTTEWGAFSAASILVAIPVMALFLYSSKWLISGLTLGSVKG